MPEATQPAHASAESQIPGVRGWPVSLLQLQASPLFKIIFPVFKKRVKIPHPNVPSLTEDEAQIDCII